MAYLYYCSIGKGSVVGLEVSKAASLEYFPLESDCHKVIYAIKSYKHALFEFDSIIDGMENLMCNSQCTVFCHVQGDEKYTLAHRLANKASTLKGSHV